MKLNVGSKNITKVNAVKDCIQLYPDLFVDAEVVGVAVEVELFGHPKSLEETVNGAVERAKKAFRDCAYSFGLEGGLLEVPSSKSGFMEIGVCAIYDGKNLHLGLSPAFEWPLSVTELTLSNKADASQAFKQLGFTHHEKLGNVEGGILGFLTAGRYTREEQTKSSIMMALIHLERPEFFIHSNS
ncbi:MAG: DUF84 family protein [bacterium]|nr:DUF84 family protein [bacterium]